MARKQVKLFTLEEANAMLPLLRSILRDITDLAKRLDAAVTAGETKSLILIAPPRALGMIRHAFSAAVRDAVRAEIHKDYVKMPVHEIEKHLAA